MGDDLNSMQAILDSFERMKKEAAANALREEIEAYEAMAKLAAEQEDVPEEHAKILEENFWDCLA